MLHLTDILFPYTEYTETSTVQSYLSSKTNHYAMYRNYVINGCQKQYIFIRILFSRSLVRNQYISNRSVNFINV